MILETETMFQKIRTEGVIAIKYDRVNCHADFVIVYVGPKYDDRDVNLQLRKCRVNIDRTMELQTALNMALAHFAESMSRQSINTFLLYATTQDQNLIREVKIETNLFDNSRISVYMSPVCPPEAQLDDTDRLAIAYARSEAGLNADTDLAVQYKESLRKLSPTFWCEHCRSLQQSTSFQTTHKTDRDAWTAICPCCGRLATGGQESIFATIRRQLHGKQ